MARIDVKTNVTAPSEIHIPLVRADHAATANIFRIFFEVFLSIFSTLLGYVLGLDTPDKIQWAFLSVCGLAALAFLSLSAYYGRESRKV